MNRSSRSAASIALLALLAALFATAAGAAAPRAQIGMLLRLHELRGGYTVGDDFGCAGISPEGAEPRLATFLEHHLVGACEAEYDRRYALPGKGPDPPLVVSAVLDFGNPRTVRKAGAVLPELVARLTGNILPREEVPTVAVGTQTRLFHGKANVLGHGHPGSILTWRQGRLIGMTLAAGEGARADDQVAAELARMQRSHMSLTDALPAPRTRRHHGPARKPGDHAADLLARPQLRSWCRRQTASPDQRLRAAARRRGARRDQARTLVRTGRLAPRHLDAGKLGHLHRRETRPRAARLALHEEDGPPGAEQ